MKRARRRKAKSFVMTFLIGMASGLAVMPLFFVFIFVLRNGFPAFDWNFFTSLPAPMGQSGGGMANALLGSLIMVGAAGLIAIPIGILIGVFLAEYPQDRFPKVVRFVVDLLMGIPSIVIGLFAYSLIVIPMKSFSGWAGSFALIMIMLPPIVKSTEEVLRLVPLAVREAGLALGLSRWRVSLFVVLRGQKAAVTTGVMLAIARAGGETAPLLFTSFGNQFWPQSMSQPMPSLPVQIYNYAISPFPDAHRQAWAGACLLLLVMFIVNLTSRLLTSRGNK
jgi:phosphate transport system permease protein